MPAAPHDDTVYLNIGDMLTRLSNGIEYLLPSLRLIRLTLIAKGYLPSAFHRVITPYKETLDANGTITVPDRYSIAYFVLPDPSRTIDPPKSLVEAEGVKRFEPVGWAEYLHQMLTASETRSGSSKPS